MISFGLVNIPVKIYSAARDLDISFHQMHKDDHGRVRYAKVCKTCGNELGKDDIIKGYEYRKGQYVTLSDEELETVNVKTAKSIGISSFVDSTEVEPLEFEKAYYVGPDSNGERAYALLREALTRSNKIAIGKVSMRAREQLVAIRVVGNMLVLETMHFADEIVKPEGIGIPGDELSVSDSELDLAKVLIEHMTAPFDLEAYHDEYEKALKDLINKKIGGEEITAPSEPQPTNVIDIMAALKASLEAAEKEKVPVKRKTAA